MLFAGLLLAAGFFASRFYTSLVPYLLGLVLLITFNLLGTLDALVGELIGSRWTWVQLALLVGGVWALFRYFREGLLFVALLVGLNVSGLGLEMQRLAWQVYGLERRAEGQRVFCPDRLEAGARAYRVTEQQTGRSVLVRTGRSALSRGPALCAVTTRYLPLPDRFDRWDADRLNIRTFMSVSDYRAVVFYPSLRRGRMIFPVSISGGVMRLQPGTYERWGVRIEAI